LALGPHPAHLLRHERVLAARLGDPAGDREPHQGALDLILGVLAGERGRDRALGARHPVDEQRQDRRGDPLDHGVGAGGGGRERLWHAAGPAAVA
jgi:hypothetical protein